MPRVKFGILMAPGRRIRANARRNAAGLPCLARNRVESLPVNPGVRQNRATNAAMWDLRRCLSDALFRRAVR